MNRPRIVAFLSALLLTTGLAVFLPASSSTAATPCAAAWSSSTVYVNGNSSSYNSHNWQAKWWTQGDTPGGSAGVWADQGTCDAGGGGGTTGGGSGCSYPAWVAGQAYTTGAIVQYGPNGQYYIATHDNPGYDPTISTWYWSPYACSGSGGSGGTGGFVVSEAQFNQMFPNRNGFYTYSGLVAALSAYPGFATTGSATVQKQEAAAFLANVDHETGGLVYVTEIDKSGNYCASEPYGCPAGTYAYYGRGPIQLSWNFNYKAAGDALGVDLLDNPGLVETDAATAWKTGLWYWDTQTGPGTMTAHDAMVNSAGFGQTIRSINGSIECNGGNTAEMQDRVNDYQAFTSILGVPAGSNLTC
ncbi:glycoside hydrolase family 19 protein [Kitasatospora mediocidica]|uniref:glycoside hydrolase family 19 protein n=1 Tax=Kitasatospora mediocidica TaxID=58352 RepID=UPI0005679268|nr:glycoside hydrolase family 19 protein [Kitasatospora mediocidica]